MPRLTLAELERRCQKPDYQRSGNWMARRISRPAALHVTWLIASSGVSAHAMTGLATVVALSAAGCFGAGTIGTCVLGALLLQLWYLLDHVDGQLARLNRTSSLDGIQLDYLMHHVVNLVVPFSIGYGAGRGGEEAWLLLGCAFALGLVLIGLANDTRYKAFIARLKQLEGPLLVKRHVADERVADDRGTNGCTARLRQTVHLARKLCEIHVVMNLVTATAIVQCLIGQTLPIKVYLALMAPIALVTALATLVRDARREAAEHDFAAWFASADGHSLDPRA